MKKNIILFVVGVALSLNACKVSSQSKKTPQQEKNIEQKVDSVLALMTLEEKIGQMIQYNGRWEATGPCLSQLL